MAYFFFLSVSQTFHHFALTGFIGGNGLERYDDSAYAHTAERRTFSTAHLRARERATSRYFPSCDRAIGRLDGIAALTEHSIRSTESQKDEVVVPPHARALHPRRRPTNPRHLIVSVALDAARARTHAEWDIVAGTRGRDSIIAIWPRYIPSGSRSARRDWEASSARPWPRALGARECRCSASIDQLRGTVDLRRDRTVIAILICFSLALSV